VWWVWLWLGEEGRGEGSLGGGRVVFGGGWVFVMGGGGRRGARGLCVAGGVEGWMRRSLNQVSGLQWVGRYWFEGRLGGGAGFGFC